MLCFVLFFSRCKEENLLNIATFWRSKPLGSFLRHVSTLQLPRKYNSLCSCLESLLINYSMFHLEVLPIKYIKQHFWKKKWRGKRRLTMKNIWVLPLIKFSGWGKLHHCLRAKCLFVWFLFVRDLFFTSFVRDLFLFCNSSTLCLKITMIPII